MLTVIFPTEEEIDLDYGSFYIFKQILGRCHVDFSKCHFETLHVPSDTTCLLLVGADFRCRSVDETRGCVEWWDPAFPGRVNRNLPCISTYHPDRLRLDHSLCAIVAFDVRKAYEIATGVMEIPTYRVREITLADVTDDDKREKKSADIEGGMEGITMCGFTYPDECKHTAEVMVADSVEKLDYILTQLESESVLQNALYEMFICAWVYGAEVGVSADTMLMAWELFAELPRGWIFRPLCTPACRIIRISMTKTLQHT